MLPRCHRLTRGKDFARVRRRGRSSGSSMLKLFVLTNRSEELRVGFAVSKRVGKAAVRNHVKRRLREAVRAEIPIMKVGLDLVIIARPPAADASFASLADDIADLLRKTGALALAREEARRA